MMQTARRFTATVSVLCMTWLSSCSLAPVFHRPTMDIPQSYKEDHGQWATVDTSSADKDRGPWWKEYKDDDLDALESKVAAANENLKAALARYDEARAIAAQARAGYFPTLTATSNATREASSQTIAEVGVDHPFNDFLIGADLSYELDIWGKVRNTVKAGESRATAVGADLATMDLSLHAELAMDYFALRGDDASQTLLDATVKAYEKALELTEARHEGGIAAEADVDQAKTQLGNAKTQAADNHLKRAQLEHAIAVLSGQMPSTFQIEPKNQTVAIAPQVPSLPSTLIEQRPDIAAASLRVEAANADIGVARAAYYPDFTFDSTLGFESAFLSKLISTPSLFWSFGPSAMMPLFDGGRINALGDQARAAYNESVANYRQTVLTAFQQVEDSLVALHQLEQEDISQTAAATAAKRSLAQAENRYKGGIATYLDVVVAQNASLHSELSSIDITTRRLSASVMLIKALGGGWHAASTTTPDAAKK